MKNSFRMFLKRLKYVEEFFGEHFDITRKRPTAVRFWVILIENYNIVKFECNKMHWCTEKLWSLFLKNNHEWLPKILLKFSRKFETKI